jgi:hypothetical protein
MSEILNDTGSVVTKKVSFLLGSHLRANFGLDGVDGTTEHFDEQEIMFAHCCWLGGVKLDQGVRLIDHTWFLVSNGLDCDDGIRTTVGVLQFGVRIENRVSVLSSSFCLTHFENSKLERSKRTLK